MDATYDEAPYRRLLAGLAYQDPDAPALVAALEEVVERLVVPALFVELDWRTTGITPADDLERGAGDRQSASRDWDRLRRPGRGLELGSVEGRRRDVPATLPPDPSADPVHAQVRGLAGRSGTLAWSVQEWAVRDLDEHAVATERLLLELAERTGADTGFVTLDVARAMDPSSPWEQVVGQPPTWRDFRRQAWSLGWGTLLGPEQVERLEPGALAALTNHVPDAAVARRSDGAAWIRLGPDPRVVTREQVRRLREILRPVLPTGTRPVDEWSGPAYLV